ncbi:Myb/SANT-like domain [Sesbania bispinosa]|nr:Myb/SANT-like domain [Sesbania bispinosa]
MNRGNRIGGNWTPEAYAHVVAALIDGGVGEVTKQHVKNKMKTTKEKFAEAFDLFNSLSGFAWNPTTRRFEAEDEVWEDFIRDKPHATKWRTMQIRHYNLLKGLFGADRAGGQRAKCGKQILKNYENQTIDLNDGGEDTSMHDQDVTNHKDVQNSAPNVESFSPASAPSNQSTGTPRSRGTKRKAPMGRNSVEPRFMNIEFFRTNGLQFQELLEYQGLKDFVSIKCEYLIELVKVFYCNLTISNGDLCSEVKRVKIRVKPVDWLNNCKIEISRPTICYAHSKLLEPYGVDTAKKVRSDRNNVTMQRWHMNLPMWGTTNVTHVQSVDDNMHRILTAIEALHHTMIEHHKKVEKKIEEMVNRIQSIEDRRLHRQLWARMLSTQKMQISESGLGKVFVICFLIRLLRHIMQ